MSVVSAVKDLLFFTKSIFPASSNRFCRAKIYNDRLKRSKLLIKHNVISLEVLMNDFLCM